MFWRVLKPTSGLADEPSAREQSSGLRVLDQVAVVGFAFAVHRFLETQVHSLPTSIAPNPGKLPRSNFRRVPSSLRELGNPILKNIGSTNPGYTIRRTAPEVRLQFSVADERGRLIINLSVDDIRIPDDYFAVHRILQFSRAEDLPLQIGLLLDASDSVKKTVGREKQAT